MTTKIASEAGKAPLKSIELKSKDDIKSEQDIIRKDIVGLDQRIHANAIQCMLHAEKHGDVSLFRRLLTEIIDAKTGYRRQGLINWMRKHSPMELKGTDMNLSGAFEDSSQVATMRKAYPDVDPELFKVGLKRPFLIEQANLHPFWTDTANAERVSKPIFQASIKSKVATAIKEVKAAAENTVNGKPVDASKPFYDGLEMDNVVSIFANIEAELAKLPRDTTAEVRKAQSEQRRLGEFVENNKDTAHVVVEDERKTA